MRDRARLRGPQKKTERERDEEREKDTEGMNNASNRRRLMKRGRK